MTDDEIASVMRPKEPVEQFMDSLSRMTELAPNVHVFAKSVDLNRPRNDYEKDVLEPRSAYVVGISMDF